MSFRAAVHARLFYWILFFAGAANLGVIKYAAYRFSCNLVLRDNKIIFITSTYKCKENKNRNMQDIFISLKVATAFCTDFY